MELFVKIIHDVNLKSLTVLAKRLLDWVQNVALHVGKTLFLNLKLRCFTDSK